MTRNYAYQGVLWFDKFNTNARLRNNDVKSVIPYYNSAPPMFNNTRISKKWIIFLMSSLIIVGSLYFFVSKKIDEYRMANIREDYLIYYAGCDKISPAGTNETDPDIVREYWRTKSQEWHFDYADVVAYMMEHCPPKNDAEIESLYSYLLDGTDRYPDMDEKQEGLNRMNDAKSVRDYKLKFINKDLEIFRQ